MEVYSLEGNMPTGQPTSVPSTTAPTNYKFKVVHEGWATDNDENGSTMPMASVAVLYMTGIILFFLAEYKVAHTLKESYNLKEKLMNKIEAEQGRTCSCCRRNEEISDSSNTMQKHAPPPSMPVIHESEELTMSPLLPQEKPVEAEAGAGGDTTLSGLDSTIYAIEGYIDRAILADMGVYSDRVPWAKALFQEISVFNDYFNAFSMTSLRDCIININSFHKASWNRSVQLLNLTTRCTFAFLMVALLLARQIPVNDGTCSMQETTELCESFVTTLPPGIPLCYWKYDNMYCAFKNNQDMYYDPRLLLFAVLIATMLVAPVSFLLDHSVAFACRPRGRSAV